MESRTIEIDILFASGEPEFPLDMSTAPVEYAGIDFDALGYLEGKQIDYPW